MIYLCKLSQFFSLFVWIQSQHGHNPLPSMTPHFNSWVWNLQMWPTFLWISCNFFLSDYDKRMFLSPAHFQPIHHRSNRIQKITTEALKVPHNGGSGTELVYLASRGLLDISIPTNTHIYTVADITPDVFYHWALLFCRWRLLVRTGETDIIVLLLEMVTDVLAKLWQVVSLAADCCPSAWHLVCRFGSLNHPVWSGHQNGYKVLQSTKYDFSEKNHM